MEKGKGHCCRMNSFRCRREWSWRTRLDLVGAQGHGWPWQVISLFEYCPANRYYQHLVVNGIFAYGGRDAPSTGKVRIG